jgi:hypothetical protein
LQRDRLFQKAHRAHPGCLGRCLDACVPRHHDHRHIEKAALHPLAQQSYAVGVGHPDVEQHEVGPRPLAGKPRLRRVFSLNDLMAFVSQDLAEEFPDTDLVVNDQNFCHTSSWSAQLQPTPWRASVGKTMLT